MLDRHSIQPAEIPPDTPPLLMVIIDTEEEFDWHQPLARENRGVSSMAGQFAAQEVFAKFDVVPTYVIDHPVASTDSSIRVLSELLSDGVCEVGTHLHPWVSPPHDEEVTPFNSYPGNLPADLERQKLEVLTETIESNLGVRPTVYKAGRYGVGPNTAAILESLGYDVDVSVVAHSSFTGDGGPDFRGFGNAPYWFGANRKLLEIPLTCGFTGALSSSGPGLYPTLSGDLGMKLHLPGVAARSGLLERVRLTPEDVDHAAHRRLLDRLLAQGERVFSMAYHSPSLAPGHTPYVRDQAELKSFLNTIERTLDYFMNELSGQPTTPQRLFERLKQ